MLTFGILYWLMPRIFDTKLHSTKLANTHFWLGTLGIIFYAVGIISMLQTSFSMSQARSIRIRSLFYVKSMDSYAADMIFYVAGMFSYVAGIT